MSLTHAFYHPSEHGLHVHFLSGLPSGSVTVTLQVTRRNCPVQGHTTGKAQNSHLFRGTGRVSTQRQTSRGFGLLPDHYFRVVFPSNGSRL